jgi:hypothetical protein
MLERQMQEMRELPDRLTGLESQILQHSRRIASEVSAIRDKVDAGDAETRVFMRVLYEDVLARINVLGEGYDSER